MSDSYSELNREDYLRFQTFVLREKGGDHQREFLEVAEDNEQFLAFIEARVRVIEGNPCPLFVGALTESSFRELTADQERSMYEAWSALKPRTACRVSFWAKLTLEHIRSGKIREASWLASNGGSADSGAERIDRALNLDSDDSSKAIDGCVRTMFRRMSGLPLVRGNRSVFRDPPFARAWWRERLVARILGRAAVQSREELLSVVRRSPEYWERLVTMIVSRGSVFGSVQVQDAIVNGLARH